MKRISAIVALMIAAICASAKEVQTEDVREAFSSWYSSLEVNWAGGDYNRGNPDFGIYGSTYNIGYRFNSNWAVYIPVSADIILQNRLTSRNFVEQGTLGIGGSYQLNLNHKQALEFCLTAASTYIPSDINYFKARFMINFGLHSIGTAPYIGLGVSYFQPYEKHSPLRIMPEATIGIKLF